MGRRKKEEVIKKQFTLRTGTVAALREDFAAYGHLSYPDLSAFADGVLGIALGGERRRHVRFQQAGVRSRELLFRQRDRAEANYWRVYHQATKLDAQYDKVNCQFTRHGGMRGLDSPDPLFEVAREFAALYVELRNLMVSDNKSVSVSLRTLLRHLIDGVGTDSLPESYARQVRATYDRLCARRAVPPDDQAQAV